MEIRGDRIRAILESRKITQTAFLARVQRYRPEMSWRTLNETINGKRQPKAEIAQALADALGVDPAYLFGLTEKPGGQGAAALPTPEPDLAGLVRRLNAQPTSVRSRLTEIVEQILDTIQYVATPHDMRLVETLTPSQREQRWLIQFEDLSLEDLQSLEDWLDETMRKRRLAAARNSEPRQRSNSASS